MGADDLIEAHEETVSALVKETASALVNLCVEQGGKMRESLGDDGAYGAVCGVHQNYGVPVITCKYAVESTREVGDVGINGFPVRTTVPGFESAVYCSFKGESVSSGNGKPLLDLKGRESIEHIMERFRGR
ncbi:hypothetical protein HYX10_02845 [Candidatus Woesearchaeota archaeon]|nr:hypothetical protein [Candidatus Woesearchaeota archaeon]